MLLPTTSGSMVGAASDPVTVLWEIALDKTVIPNASSLGGLTLSDPTRPTNTLLISESGVNFVNMLIAGR